MKHFSGELIWRHRDPEGEAQIPSYWDFHDYLQTIDPDVGVCKLCVCVCVFERDEEAESGYVCSLLIPLQG